MSNWEEWIKGKTIADWQLGISLFIDIDSCFCLSSYIQYIQTPYKFFLFCFCFALRSFVLLLFFFLSYDVHFFLNRWDLMFGKNGARHLCILHVLLKDSFYASVFVFNQVSFFIFYFFILVSSLFLLILSWIIFSHLCMFQSSFLFFFFISLSSLPSRLFSFLLLFSFFCIFKNVSFSHSFSLSLSLHLFLFFLSLLPIQFFTSFFIFYLYFISVFI